MNRRPGQQILIAASAVVVLFSFFNFYDLDLRGTSEHDARKSCEAMQDANDRVPSGWCDVLGDGGASAWNTTLWFPLSTWPALAAAAALLIALAGARFPEDKVGFSAGEACAALGVVATVIMVGWLVGGSDDPFEFAIGFWMMLLGSVGLLLGAAMEVTAERGGGLAGAGTRPPSPF